MKKYNTYLASLLLLFTTLGTQSCLNDTNEWAESFKDTLLGMGTVQTLDEDDYYFLLDEGSKLYPTDRSEVRNYEAKDGQRAFVYFDKLPEELPGYEYNAKIRYIEDILTKDIYHMPAEIMGSPSMPAPLAVPATIMEPPRWRWKVSPNVYLIMPPSWNEKKKKP